MSQSENASISAIEQRLRADLAAAMRERDQVRMDTLRMALGAFHNEEVARTDTAHRQHRQPLTEADRIALLERQIKQRDEAASLFRHGNRPELAEKEAREASLLQVYMPARLADDAIRAIVARLIAASGHDFKAVMPLAARETKGRADGKRVSEIVREMTA